MGITFDDLLTGDDKQTLISPLLSAMFVQVSSHIMSHLAVGLLCA